MFAVSVILFPSGNFSLLESTSHQQRGILDMKFPANIVVPLLLRWRPSLNRWDSRMFLWKITFFSSHFNISIYFFMTSFAFFLSVRTWGRRYKYSYSQDDELWSNLWFVWALHKGQFHFYIAHHSSQYK